MAVPTLNRVGYLFWIGGTYLGQMGGGYLPFTGVPSNKLDGGPSPLSRAAQRVLATWRAYAPCVHAGPSCAWIMTLVPLTANKKHQLFNIAAICSFEAGARFNQTRGTQCASKCLRIKQYLNEIVLKF